MDQTADIYIGTHQRASRYKAILKSFVARGFANLIPFLAAQYFGTSMIHASFLAAALSIAALYSIDLRVEKTPRPKTNALVLHFSQVKGQLKSTAFPVLDAVHFNSFRYAIYAASGAGSLGLVGVAQSIFTPIQMAVTALGASQIAQVQTSKRTIDATSMNATSRFALIATILSTVFLAVAFIIPKSIAGLIFGISSEDGISSLRCVAIAMLPWGAAAIFGQSLLINRKLGHYSVNPAIGLFGFWFGYFVLLLTNRTDLLALSLLTATSFFLRAAHARMIASHRLRSTWN